MHPEGYMRIFTVLQAMHQGNGIYKCCRTYLPGVESIIKFIRVPKIVQQTLAVPMVRGFR